MIKKSKSKKIAVSIVLILFIISVGAVFASGAIVKTIKVTYNNIKLVVDGKPVDLGKDSAGKQIEPFIHNGTTYLPVRAVGESLDQKVKWDGKEQTVYLGDVPGEISYMTEEIEPYQNSNLSIYRLNSVKNLNIAGNKFETGYNLNFRGYMSFNLNSGYNTLSFKYGPISKVNWDADTKYYIYLDNKLFKEYSLSMNDPVKDATIDVSGVNQLRIESQYTGQRMIPVYPIEMGIGNPTLQ